VVGAPRTTFTEPKWERHAHVAATSVAVVPRGKGGQGQGHWN